MSTILDEILAHKREEIASRKRECPEPELRAHLERLRPEPPRKFAEALHRAQAAGRIAMIAEMKRASPSRGLIREDYQPEAIARSYQEAGASCLSVLTDQKFFQGSLEHLRQARKAVQLPVLRKDFLIDSYQVYEARLAGADCVLLIAAALEDAKLCELHGLATHLGMDVLIEVHDRTELTRAMMLRTELIGINNRNLRDFSIDLQTTIDLMADMPADRMVVTESGIHTPEQVALLHSRGAHAFLIGEALMDAVDPGARLRELFFHSSRHNRNGKKSPSAAANPPAAISRQ